MGLRALQYVLSEHTYHHEELYMNKLINSLLVAAALFVGSAAFAEPVPGRDYTLLKQPQPTATKNIEVLEFFFYGCSHCYHLHPLLSEWEKTMPKDVEMILVPTIFRDNWKRMGGTFYELERLGQQQKLT